MKTVTFQPIGEVLDVMEFEHFKEFVIESKIKSINPLFIKECEEKVENFHKRYNEILDCISQYWGKFIHIKFSYNTNYSETRETNPKWETYYEANVMPYCYVPDNHCLFGLYCKLNDTYRGGIEDKSINLLDLVQRDMLEINEITEEEFLNTANNTVFDCLLTRCNKIESGDYELTNFGYKSTKKVDIDVSSVLK